MGKSRIMSAAVVSRAPNSFPLDDGLDALASSEVV
jgi:hypothetical protein